MRLSLLLLVAMTATSLAGDEDYSNPETGDGSWPGPSADERFCGEKYVLAKKPSKADTKRCAEFFYSSAKVGGVWNYKLTRPQIATIRGRMDACQCGDDPAAIHEALTAAEQVFLGLTDPSTGDSVEPILGKLLAGKAITRAEIRLASPLVLWWYRNAPYARHGRAFKSPELQAFFYGKRGAEDGPVTSKLLPLAPNKAYSDSLLDKVDSANVSLIVGEIRRRKAE